MDPPRQMSFPPQVLARIAPDVSLQRHLAIGLRPCLRNFVEFKPMEVSVGNMNALGANQVVGSSVVKNGDTTVICGITFGVVEASGPEPPHATVFPTVDILRGRSGAPTDEEMMLSQKLYETVLHGRTLALDQLRVSLGVQTGPEEIIYPGDFGSFAPETREFLEGNKAAQKSYRYVLYAHVKVFSRLGPLFDVCYTALTSALRNTALPAVYLHDSSFAIKVPTRSRGKCGNLAVTGTQHNLSVDSDSLRQLTVGSGFALSFGLVELEKPEVAEVAETAVDTESAKEPRKTVLLADLEGDAEEACVVSRASVVAGENGRLMYVLVCGGGANFTLEALRQSISLASARAAASVP